MIFLDIYVVQMIQAVENYKNGNTGQLSSITVALLFFGSLARIFTSVQETGDITFILSFTIATLCNAILLGQVCISQPKPIIRNYLLKMLCNKIKFYISGSMCYMLCIWVNTDTVHAIRKSRPTKI